jgi:hypothetical protein
MTFTLDSETDRDLVRWLDRQDNRSAAIREAIREHIGGAGVTLGDVYQAVKDLDHKVQAGVIVAGTQDQADEWEEPPEAAAALDALANL